MGNAAPIAKIEPGRRAVIYTRQSAYREESMSLASQEHIARSYCEQRGYSVVAVYSDGVSGRAWATRPGVAATLETVESNQADVIVVWKWSRLSRNRMHWAIASDRADAVGGRIESATEPVDTNTAAGRFNRGVMLEMAQFESDRIGEQWREVREHRRRQGLPPTGGPRFGYRRDDDGFYHPDPETAPTLVEMYEMFLSGRGAAYITRILNQRGSSRFEKPWTYQAVMQVMDAGFGAGILVEKRRPGQKPWERPSTPGAHEPVIDPETWAAYLAARKRRVGKKQARARRYPLVGLLRCTDCGGAMSGYTENGYHGYRCSRATQTYNPGLRRIAIRAARVETEVEEWLFSLADEIHASPVDFEKVQSARADDRAFERRSLEKRLERAESRIRTLTLRLADETITSDVYREATDECRREIEETRSRLVELAPNPVTRRSVAKLPKDLRDLWSALTVEQRSNILRPLIERVEVSPAKRRGDPEGRVKIVPVWGVD